MQTKTRSSCHFSGWKNSRIFPFLAIWFIALSLGISWVPEHLVGATVAAQNHVYPGETWERITNPESVGYDSKKLQGITEYVKTLNTTAVMAVVGGKVLYEYGDLQEISYLASVRKSILAMLYGNYVKDGTVQLNKTLADLGMDDVQGLLPVEKQATVDHLITARSGIYHPASNSGDNSADAPPRGSQKPGEYFLYNNWDFNAAGAAFEKMTGKNIYDVFGSDLARPTGMQDFDRSIQRKSGNLKRSMYPAYHFRLSTRDMARIGYLMLREGNWAGRQLIPKDWAHKIVSLVTPLEEMNPESVRRGAFGYGYMWWVWAGTTATGPLKGAYSGKGAYGQYITVLPELDMVIAHKTVPSNRTSWNEYQGIIDRLIESKMK